VLQYYNLYLQFSDLVATGVRFIIIISAPVVIRVGFQLRCDGVLIFFACLFLVFVLVHYYCLMSFFWALADDRENTVGDFIVVDSLLYVTLK
jgi:hypothetical protein